MMFIVQYHYFTIVLICEMFFIAIFFRAESVRLDLNVEHTSIINYALNFVLTNSEHTKLFYKLRKIFVWFKIIKSISSIIHVSKLLSREPPESEISSKARWTINQFETKGSIFFLILLFKYKNNINVNLFQIFNNLFTKQSID